MCVLYKNTRLSLSPVAELPCTSSQAACQGGVKFFPVSWEGNMSSSCICWVSALTWSWLPQVCVSATASLSAAVVIWITGRLYWSPWAKTRECSSSSTEFKGSTWLSFHSGGRSYYKNNIQIIFKIVHIKEDGTKADFSCTTVTSGQKHLRLKGLRSTPSSQCHLQERALRGAAGQRGQGRTYCV